jgi:glycolate oxidase iron-sulfur subunit
MLMLAGCVQPSMGPNINTATARVLDACGIQTVVAPASRLLRRSQVPPQRPGRRQGADARQYRRLVALVDNCGESRPSCMNASGCGVMVKDYGHVLQDDPRYAAKAARISALTRDLSELLPDFVPALESAISPDAAQAAGLQAFHPPCTLQHGQKLEGGVETHMAALGFPSAWPVARRTCAAARPAPTACCSPTSPYQLRDRKLGHLSDMKPQGICSANIGCITHLQSGTETPVRHWVEVLDAALR